VPLLVGSTRSYSHHTPKYNQSVTNKQPSTDLARLSKTTRPIENALEQWLKDAIRQANQVIYHCNADYDISMASTLTLALLYEYQLYVASVGDSRVYRYTQGELRCLTRKNIQAIHNEPNSYLGHNYHIPVDFFSHQIEPDDQLLLCTDGL